MRTTNRAADDSARALHNKMNDMKLKLTADRLSCRAVIVVLSSHIIYPVRSNRDVAVKRNNVRPAGYGYEHIKETTIHTKINNYVDTVRVRSTVDHLHCLHCKRKIDLHDTEEKTTTRQIN